MEMELRLLECFSPVLVLLLCSNLDCSAVVSAVSLVVCQVLVWARPGHQLVLEEAAVVWYRGGILEENKFRISDDSFWIHLRRASISAKFRIICINFG